MARYAAEHHEKSHAAILEAAAALIREQGFDAASVGAVMKAVGMTHGGFYAHFADKNAMLTAAMVQALVPTVDRFDRWTAAAEAAGDPAQVAVTYLSDQHLARSGQGCAAAALISEVPRQDMALRTVFAEGVETSASILARVYPGERAWGVLALMAGALALMRAVPDAGMRADIRVRAMRDLQKLAQPD